MLLLMTLCSGLLGVWAVGVQPYREQALSEAWVLSLGGELQKRPAEGPAWQRWLVQTLLGEEAFAEVVIVDLSKIEVQGDAARRLAGLRYAEQLSLDGATIDDQAIAALWRAKHLEGLSLRYTSVTDESLAFLADLPSLEILRLTGAAVTDRGLADLAACPSLRELYIRWTNVTEQGVATFRSRHPDCAVHAHQLAARDGQNR